MRESSLSALIGISSYCTAQSYANEEEIGRALQILQFPEEFPTLKFGILTAFILKLSRLLEESLRKLKTDYVDLLSYSLPSEDVPLEETMTP